MNYHNNLVRFIKMWMCFIIFLFFQCAYETMYLSYESIEKLELTVEEIKNIQFYLSETIIIQKIKATVEKDMMENQRIQTTEAIEAQRVIIEKGTPVVITHIEKPWIDADSGHGIRLRFEMGTLMSYVRFLNDQKVYDEGEIQIKGESYRVLFQDGIPALKFNADSYQQNKMTVKKAEGQSLE